MTVSDVVVLVGVALVVAGVWGNFGWPWAAMAGGLFLVLQGAGLQRREAAKVERV